MATVQVQTPLGCATGDFELMKMHNSALCDKLKICECKLCETGDWVKLNECDLMEMHSLALHRSFRRKLKICQAKGKPFSWVDHLVEVPKDKPVPTPNKRRGKKKRRSKAKKNRRVSEL